MVTSARQLAVAGMVGLALLSGCGTSRSAPADHPLQPGTSAAPRPSSSAAPEPDSGPLRLTDVRIIESSGLARSTVHPGVLYTHNDRDDPPYLFAVDRSGTRAVLELDVPALDWEDIATSPDGRIWVGDIGDNDLSRREISVVVVQEPEVLAGGVMPAEVFRLRYPDGPHNAEALLVDPRNLRVYVVTKDPKAGAVYRAPELRDPSTAHRLTRVADAPPNVTGGDFSADGRRLVLRNQGRAFFYDRVGGPEIVVPLPHQLQGESITFVASGSAVLVGSEGVDSAVLRVRAPEPTR